MNITVGSDRATSVGATATAVHVPVGGSGWLAVSGRHVSVHAWILFLVAAWPGRSSVKYMTQ